MALADIKIVDTGGLSAVPTVRWNVEAAATQIYAGDATIIGASQKYVIVAADGDPVVGTEVFAGIAASTSTQTASADGYVELYMPIPGVVYAAKAKSAAAANTQAEIDALIGKRVVLDLTAGVYTVDTAAADGATNAIYIVGGDYTQSVIHFTVQNAGTILA